MKNIHIIPTPNQSRLQKNKHNKLFLSMEVKSYSDCTNQNIHITNNEKIKEGDWYLVELFKITGESDGFHIEKCTKLDDVWCNNFDVISTRHKDNCKKIILTTDQELIQDGVQPIDDEFLEWFVKNPSCEQIEVERWVMRVLGVWSHPYKIIIPKEEPKQELERGITITHVGKQETPTELDSVLAKITHINDLGVSEWYEVVYYADNKWCSYNGSKTFDDGERVIEWKYCKDCL
jgi:hypothetical protein